MIVNKRTRSGTFGNSDGTFTVRALRTDTLLVGSVGHRTKMLCLDRQRAERHLRHYAALAAAQRPTR